MRTERARGRHGLRPLACGLLALVAALGCPEPPLEPPDLERGVTLHRWKIEGGVRTGDEICAALASPSPRCVDIVSVENRAGPSREAWTVGRCRAVWPAGAEAQVLCTKP